MKIRRLTIKNFRSIGPEGIEVEFNTNLIALIGKNNVGKSNILRALDLIIGSSWPREENFELEDFYQKDIKNDIEICVYFDEPIEYKQTIESWYEHKTKIYGFKLEYKTYKRDTEDAKAGELHLDYFCVDNKGGIIRLPTKPLRKGRHEEFRSSFTHLLRVNKKLREEASAFFISVERNVFKVSPSNPRSLLGILIKKVREKFLDSQNKVKIEPEVANILGISNEITRKELFEKYIERANKTLKTDELNNITKTIENFLIEHVGEYEAKDLSFDFLIQDSWSQYKNISLSMQHNNLMLPADRLGHGFQSLIVIAIFRTYLELNEQNAIFLIEEPEMFLHTHAKKSFYSILQKMAASGTQIIYSTHATEFVDLINYQNIKRVLIEDGNTSVYPKGSVDLDFTEDEILRLNTAINNERAELFFAEKVILIEGETEKVVYDLLLKLAGIDPNLFNISIIETSGKGSMYRYIKLLQNFSIRFVVVCDSDILDKTGNVENDRKTEENNKDADEKNKRLKEALENKDHLIMFDPYFEVVAGINTNKNRKKESKPLTALKYFQKFKSIEELKSKYPAIVKPVEIILEKDFAV